MHSPIDFRELHDSGNEDRVARGGYDAIWDAEPQYYQNVNHN